MLYLRYSFKLISISAKLDMSMKIDGATLNNINAEHIKIDFEKKSFSFDGNSFDDLGLSCINVDDFFPNIVTELKKVTKKQDESTKNYESVVSDEEVLDDYPPSLDLKVSEQFKGEPTYKIRSNIKDLEKKTNSKQNMPLVDGKYACPIKNCSKTFERKYNARMHVLHVHMNVRNYECNACSWKSKRRYDMVRHLNTHKNEC